MDTVEFNEEQVRHIASQFKNTIEGSQRLTEEQIVGGAACFICEGALNVACGALIGGIIAAGIVAIGPETAVVVAVVAALDVIGITAAATVVAGIISGALAAAGGVTVEGVIYAICVGVGACG